MSGVVKKGRVGTLREELAAVSAQLAATTAERDQIKARVEQLETELEQHKRALQNTGEMLNSVQSTCRLFAKMLG